MNEEFTLLKPLKELPEDYKFVYKIKACECKIDFDTNTMVDKILSTRTKKVDEEVIRQLRDIGKAKGINELILIDESKVLKMIKSLKAFEIIKNKRVEASWLMMCFGFVENSTNKKECDYYNNNYEAFRKSKPLTQEEFDLLKEVLL